MFHYLTRPGQYVLRARDSIQTGFHQKIDPPWFDGETSYFFCGRLGYIRIRCPVTQANVEQGHDDEGYNNEQGA